MRDFHVFGQKAVGQKMALPLKKSHGHAIGPRLDPPFIFAFLKKSDLSIVLAPMILSSSQRQMWGE
jgi:hypothetical protein